MNFQLPIISLINSCSFVESKSWSPCPENWIYARNFGACYFFLPKWSEYTWMEAKLECEKFGNISTLFYSNEEKEEELAFSQFWKLTTTFIWLGANYSDGA